MCDVIKTVWSQLSCVSPEIQTDLMNRIWVNHLRDQSGDSVWIWTTMGWRNTIVEGWEIRLYCVGDGEISAGSWKLLFYGSSVDNCIIETKTCSKEKNRVRDQLYRRSSWSWREGWLAHEKVWWFYWLEVWLMPTGTAWGHRQNKMNRAAILKYCQNSFILAFIAKSLYFMELENWQKCESPFSSRF